VEEERLSSSTHPGVFFRTDVLKPRPCLLWQTAQEIVRSDFRAELASIHIPSLIPWGERDVLLPLASGQQLRKALPHATFISLPNCGHRPPLSQPELFSRFVLEWLSSPPLD
jgi:pimeloyl-ACP methyl ester carboxylesterase